MSVHILFREGQKIKTSLDFNYVKPCLDLIKLKLREAFRKKTRKIYDDLLKGGWVANSKHDFFSIKNYDIIAGRVGDRLTCHNFQIIIFHKKSL